MMKKLFIILALLINTVTLVQAQNIEGEWTPDESSYLGEIRIKHIEGNKYKVRLQTRDGLQTINATYSNSELYGKYEDENPNYGEFWVGSGPIEKGHKSTSPRLYRRQENADFHTNFCSTDFHKGG